MNAVLQINNILQQNNTNAVNLCLLSDSVWLLIFATETLGAL